MLGGGGWKGVEMPPDQGAEVPPFLTQVLVLVYFAGGVCHVSLFFYFYTSGLYTVNGVSKSTGDATAKCNMEGDMCIVHKAPGVSQFSLGSQVTRDGASCILFAVCCLLCCVVLLLLFLHCV